MDNNGIIILKSIKEKTKNVEYSGVFYDSIKLLKIHNRGTNTDYRNQAQEVLDSKVMSEVIDSLSGCIVSESGDEYTVVDHGHRDKELFSTLLSSGSAIYSKIQNVQWPSLCKIRLRLDDDYILCSL